MMNVKKEYGFSSDALFYKVKKHSTFASLWHLYLILILTRVKHSKINF